MTAARSGAVARKLKLEAARAALPLVQNGYRLGLGTGSTVTPFLELLGKRLASGELTGVTGVATSIRTERSAREFGIPIASLQELAPLDLTVDGADEIGPELDLIKGLGGALLREKMVATASRRFVVIADESKLVATLGARSPLPVEVVPFEWEVHLPFLAGLGTEPALRRDEQSRPYETDNGNFIIDCRFTPAALRPLEIETRLRARPGVVETGLFLQLASDAFVATADGVRHLERGPST